MGFFEWKNISHAKSGNVGLIWAVCFPHTLFPTVNMSAIDHTVVTVGALLEFCAPWLVPVSLASTLLTSLFRCDSHSAVVVNSSRSRQRCCFRSERVNSAFKTSPFMFHREILFELIISTTKNNLQRASNGVFWTQWIFGTRGETYVLEGSNSLRSPEDHAENFFFENCSRGKIKALTNSEKVNCFLEQNSFFFENGELKNGKNTKLSI